MTEENQNHGVESFAEFVGKDVLFFKRHISRPFTGRLLTVIGGFITIDFRGQKQVFNTADITELVHFQPKGELTC